MERLREIFEQYGRWLPFEDYVRRIDTYKDADFSICIENAKALLESIGKQVCEDTGKKYSKTDTTGKILKLAFTCFDYNNNASIQQIGGAIANIGSQMALLRNEIGSTSHGKTLSEMGKRTEALSELSATFLLSSTELVSCFLIKLLETEFPRRTITEIKYEDNPEFNDYWDDLSEEYQTGEYSFQASEILFRLDPTAYSTELNNYREMNSEDNN